MEYGRVIQEVAEETRPFQKEGAVADYIPELGRVDPNKFGLHLYCLDGQTFESGDSRERFSIQSISKVLSVALAFSRLGDQVWERVGVEPSGNPFNSLVQLEYENGIPRNPLINSGALVVSDMLISLLENPKRDFLDYVRHLADNQHIQYDEKVAWSERTHGYRNAALANLLKAFGNLENEVEEVLDFYFHQCSIAMSCEELSAAFLVFANQGTMPLSEGAFLTRSQTKRINALMQTCGFYDEAGEFAFKVGLPGKSGVGGGIVAVHPQHYSIAVWSPRLNAKGNSLRGMKALELLTTKTGFSIF